MEVATATTEAPTPSQSAEQPVVEQPSKYKVKVDGEDMEVDLAELQRGYTHGKAANKKFQEAANLSKQVQSLLERARGGDLSWLRDIVPDDVRRQFAQAELLEHIEYEQLSEEQKELRAEKAEKARLKAELEKLNEEKTTKEQQALMARAYQEIDQEISSTLKELGRKPSPRLIRRIAEQMYANLQEEGAEPLPAKSAYQRAAKGIEQDLVEWIEHAPVEEVLKSIPKAKLDAIRRHFVEEVRPVSSAPRQLDDDTPARPTKVKRMRSDQWFDKMDKKLGVR
jgi:uncharacterized protein (UPF0147 family)